MTKILYVDNHPDRQVIVTQFLELADFEVNVADNGLMGLEKAHLWQPDLVLTNLKLPRHNGLKLTANLRVHQATRSIPIIMMSIWSTDDEKDQALAVGADEFLTYPFDFNELMAVIQNHLDLS